MDFINPQSDFAFKRLFGNEKKPNIVISFLNAAFDFTGTKKIKGVTFMDPYIRQVTKRQKMSIIDVKCTDLDGHKFIIEIQVDRDKDFPERVQDYVASNIIDQLEAGQDYEDLLPVYFLGVLNFKMVTCSEEPINSYRIVNIHHESGKKIMVDDGLFRLSHWMFIELGKFNKAEKECVTLVDKWIYVLKNAADMKEIPALFGTEKEICEALGLLNKGGMNAAELEQYRDSMRNMRAERSVIATAREDGKAEEKRAMAKNLLRKKMSVADIAEVTGLSVNEIEKLF